jgi:molybdopterin-guanine dinucleotide biosynthesis protein A
MLAGSDFASPTHDVVAALDPRIVEWPDEEPFFTVNGPEDILQAAALLGGR